MVAQFCIKRGVTAEAAGMGLATLAAFLGITQNLADRRLYNEFKNAKRACLSLGLSSRKPFLTSTVTKMSRETW